MITETDGLASSPVMFLFLDVSSLPRHRRMYEDDLGLTVIENQFHPPHEHHGLVKYDVGTTILAVNLFAERKFRGGSADGVTVVFRTARPEIAERFGGYDRTYTDVDGHHYAFAEGAPADPALACGIQELRFAVPELPAATAFYGDVLGLRAEPAGERRCRFRTGSVDLLVYQSERAPDGRPIRHSACLTVFYAADVREAERALRKRGLAFSSSSAFSDIGGTARFRDPSGHTFCLYQPSAESLTWGSAGKVLDLMTGGGAGPR